MRKLLIGLLVLLLLIAGAIGALLATGQIASSSLAMILNTMLGVSGPAANDATVRQRYQVPEGFSLALYAADVPRARL